MSLSCGIVGLPNVGKSTLFSALTKSMAEAQNYPFTTIEPNVGIVNVPDERLNQIAAIVNPERIVPSTVKFVDVAGLVKGASTGEGLGNKFLSHIREVEAIIQVVRLFDDKDIIHVHGKVDPLFDLDVILTELILKDIETLTKRKEKIEKLSKSDKQYQEELTWINKVLPSLNENIPLNKIIKEEEEIPSFVHDLRPITIKPMLIAANMDEENISSYETNPLFKELKSKADEIGIDVIPFCAKLELDLLSLSSEEEQQELMDLYQIKTRGLNQIISHGYKLLKYMSYFTAGEKEVRSWTITENTTAKESAGVIHTDFAKGFIRAEVIHFKDFIEYGGEKKAKEAGKAQLEGKEYIVEDGDIMLFRFNV